MSPGIERCSTKTCTTKSRTTNTMLEIQELKFVGACVCFALKTSTGSLNSIHQDTLSYAPPDDGNLPLRSTVPTVLPIPISFCQRLQAYIKFHASHGPICSLRYFIQVTILDSAPTSLSRTEIHLASQHIPEYPSVDPIRSRSALYRTHNLLLPNQGTKPGPDVDPSSLRRPRPRFRPSGSP